MPSDLSAYRASEREKDVLQRVATKAALLLNRSQRLITGAHANWIHVLFDKRVDTAADLTLR